MRGKTCARLIESLQKFLKLMPCITDLEFKGYPYIWCNQREEKDNIWEKIG